jgi:hypothetical protein
VLIRDQQGEWLHDEDFLRRRSGTGAGLAGPVAAGAGDRAAAGRELTDRLAAESVRPRIDSQYLLGFPGMIRI